MAYLTTAFQTLLTMALAALPVMAAVLAARFLLGKAPRRFAYLLWAVVAFRLLCPVSVESPVGLVRPVEAERQVSAVADDYAGDTRTIHDDSVWHDPAVAAGREPVTAADQPGTSKTVQNTWLLVAAAVWLAGMAVIIAVSAGAYLRLRQDRLS